PAGTGDEGWLRASLVQEWAEQGPGGRKPPAYRALADGVRQGFVAPSVPLSRRYITDPRR
ncbi:hypothetical protein, partial [Streptomyces pakalii]